MDDAPLPARGAYNIDFSQFDDPNFDPFATKSKVNTNFNTSPPRDLPPETSRSPDENREPKTENDQTQTAPAQKTITSKRATSAKSKLANRIPMQERLAALRAKKKAAQSQNADVHIAGVDDQQALTEKMQNLHVSPQSEINNETISSSSSKQSLSDKIAEMRRRKKAENMNKLRQTDSCASEITLPESKSSFQEPALPQSTEKYPSTPPRSQSTDDGNGLVMLKINEFE